MKLVRALARFPVDHRELTLLLLLLVTGAILYPFHLPKFEQEDVTDLDPNDPEMVILADFQKRFGDDEVLLLALESDDAFAVEPLTHLKRVTDAIERLPNVERVYSLFRIAEFKTEGTEIQSSPFLEDIPTDPAVRAQKRATALGNDSWRGFLLSADGTLATVTAVLRKIDGAVPHRASSAREIREIAERELPQGVTTHLAGRGAMFLDFEDSVRSDCMRYMWITPLWIAGLLIFVFRSLRGLVIPLVVCGTAVAWTVGLYLKTGNSIGMVFTMLPTQIAVICLSDVIHVLSHYREHCAEGGDRRSVLLATMERMIPACFYTAATSAIGFFSFTTAGLHSLAVFGKWTAIGIGMAWILAITLTPALLAFLPIENRHRSGLETPLSNGLVRISVSALKAQPRTKIAIGSVWAVAIVFALVGMTRLNADSDFQSFLPSDYPSARAAKVLEKKLAGTATLEVVLESRDGTEYTFEEPWAIADLTRVDEFLRQLPEIDKTFSILDFLGQVHRARGGEGALPADPASLTEAYFVLEGLREADRFVTAKRDAVRISARLTSMSTKQPVELVERIDEFAKSLDPRLKIVTTGVSKLFAATSQALVKGQAVSLFTSLLWVAVAMILALRSLRVGLLALIPNVAPIVVTLGAMGWLGLPLDIASIMVGSIALGIAVDDTIHLITRHAEEKRIRPQGALERTLRGAGPPSIFTSFLFAGGFLVFIASGFGPIRSFGGLSAGAMIVAMFADLTLLPLLLAPKGETPEERA